MNFDFSFYQHYWWFLISLLGAVLVFLLFVQGGQTLLMTIGKEELRKSMLVNSLGRKWELTFTTLVVFGGAFFASFPLFYSTSFGGAYWLWMAILFSFIIQAVSYEFRSKPNNLLGRKSYDTFLLINGVVGSVLLGVAVSTFFTGAEFTIDKGNLLSVGKPVISTWDNPLHGLEAIASLPNLLLGFTVLFLARVLGALYFINNIDDPTIHARSRHAVLYNGIVFVVLFLAYVAFLLTSTGYETEGGAVTERSCKYLHNLLEQPLIAVGFLLGVAGVLYGIIRTIVSPSYRYGIWWAGIGTVLTVLCLLLLAGYNNTPYYPSLTSPDSSLTIENSSSSLFTLQVMSAVSLLIPFVAAYIIYTWRQMNAKRITADEIEHTTDKY